MGNLRSRALSVGVLSLVGTAVLLPACSSSNKASEPKPPANFGNASNCVGDKCLGSPNVHELITRDALARLFQPESLSILAGKNATGLLLRPNCPGNSDTPGTAPGIPPGRTAAGIPSVGVPPGPRCDGAAQAPDFFRPLPSAGENHCDDGDYDIIGAANYPQKLADANEHLRNCITAFDARVASAVGFAAGLVTNDTTLGDVNLRKDGCALPSDVNKSDRNPKCSVLSQLGWAMHIAQDFYAHSNWADSQDTRKPVSLTNPPGLGRTDLPNYFNYPSEHYVLPSGLISGCDDSTPISGPKRCKDRITHSTLNKDNPRAGRGHIYFGAGLSNFQNAFTVATNQTRRIWDQFVARLKVIYPATSQLMVRALTQDYPWTACRQSGAARRALDKPNPRASGTLEVTPSISNRTGATLTCYSAKLDYGEWNTLPPDTIGPGSSGSFKPVSNGYGTEGSATYTLGTGPFGRVTIKWENFPGYRAAWTCMVNNDFNHRYKCDPSSGRGGLTARKVTPRFTLSPG